MASDDFFFLTEKKFFFFFGTVAADTYIVQKKNDYEGTKCRLQVRAKRLYNEKPETAQQRHTKKKIM